MPRRAERSGLSRSHYFDPSAAGSAAYINFVLTPEHDRVLKERAATLRALASTEDKWLRAEDRGRGWVPDFIVKLADPRGLFCDLATQAHFCGEGKRQLEQLLVHLQNPDIPPGRCCEELASLGQVLDDRCGSAFVKRLQEAVRTLDYAARGGVEAELAQVRSRLQQAIIQERVRVHMRSPDVALQPELYEMHAVAAVERELFPDRMHPPDRYAVSPAPNVVEDCRVQLAARATREHAALLLAEQFQARLHRDVAEALGAHVTLDLRDLRHTLAFNDAAGWLTDMGVRDCSLLRLDEQGLPVELLTDPTLLAIDLLVIGCGSAPDVEALIGWKDGPEEEKDDYRLHGCGEHLMFVRVNDHPLYDRPVRAADLRRLGSLDACAMRPAGVRGLSDARWRAMCASALRSATPAERSGWSPGWLPDVEAMRQLLGGLTERERANWTTCHLDALTSAQRGQLAAAAEDVSDPTLRAVLLAHVAGSRHRRAATDAAQAWRLADGPGRLLVALQREDASALADWLSLFRAASAALQETECRQVLKSCDAQGRPALARLLRAGRPELLATWLASVGEVARKAPQMAAQVCDSLTPEDGGLATAMGEGQRAAVQALLAALHDIAAQGGLGGERLTRAMRGPEAVGGALDAAFRRDQMACASEYLAAVMRLRGDGLIDDRQWCLLVGGAGGATSTLAQSIRRGDVAEATLMIAMLRMGLHNGWLKADDFVDLLVCAAPRRWLGSPGRAERAESERQMFSVYVGTAQSLRRQGLISAQQLDRLLSGRGAPSSEATGIPVASPAP